MPHQNVGDDRDHRKNDEARHEKLVKLLRFVLRQSREPFSFICHAYSPPPDLSLRERLAVNVVGAARAALPTPSVRNTSGEFLCDRSHHSGGLRSGARLDARQPLDGDVMFAASTGRRPLANALPDANLALTNLGTLAANVVARAIARGVFTAAALSFAGALPSWQDQFGR